MICVPEAICKHCGEVIWSEENQYIYTYPASDDQTKVALAYKLAEKEKELAEMKEKLADADVIIERLENYFKDMDNLQELLHYLSCLDPGDHKDRWEKVCKKIESKLGV